MASVLETRKVHRRDVNRFVLTQAYRLKDHARQMAAREGRPYQYFGERTRKEDLARQLAERDGITEESTLRQRAPAQALDQSPPRVFRRRGKLEVEDLAASFLEEDEVGERSACIDPD